MKRTAFAFVLGLFALQVLAGMQMISKGKFVLSSGSGETITWTAVTDPALDGYKVYYGTSSGVYSQNPGAGIDVGNVTSYDASALSGTYYFVVKWYDEFGNESPPSNELQKVLP